ncbi:MAG: hypothetical protein ACRC0S_03810 [Fusobacteriaceae bacterium]
MKKFIDNKLLNKNSILTFKDIFSNSFKNKYFILQNIFISILKNIIDFNNFNIFNILDMAI